MVEGLEMEGKIIKKIASLPFEKQPTDRLRAVLISAFEQCIAPLQKGSRFEEASLTPAFLRGLDCGFDFSIGDSKKRFYNRLSYWFQRLGYLNEEGIRT